MPVCGAKQNLDDRWPGAPVGMSSDYVSLNHASRIQLGTFAEWQHGWGTRWSALLGGRNGNIWMGRSIDVGLTVTF